MKTQWAFQIRASAEALDLDVYDVVGDWFGDGPTAKGVLDALAGAKGAKQINVRINSIGGVVDDGIAIYNVLGAHQAKKTVYVDGLAASIASVIAMAGDEIIMAESAMMMIHNPWGMAIGSADDMRKTAETLDKYGERIAGIYAARTGHSTEDVQAAMANETWMTAAEAKDKGYATKVTPSKKIAARAGQAFDFAAFRSVPGTVAAMAAALMQAPAAKAVPYHAYPKRDDTSWDDPAAVGRLKKWASSDGSGDKEKMDWAKYRNGFAWYDEKNAEDFGSYKLPHHDVVDGSLVTSRKGTIAAGNAVSGSRGGTNIPDSEIASVKAHLAKHYKQFDMDPPWEEEGETAPDAEPDNRSGAQITNATPVRGAERKTPMNKQELKSQHPELYTEIVAEGRDAERDRVKAHLVLGDQSGDMKTAIAAINDGSAMTLELQAKYMGAAMNRRDLTVRASEDGAAAAALGNAGTPAPNAPPAAATPVSAGVDLFLANHKKPGRVVA